jgi:Flp pilus assembly protein TadD
MGARAARLHLGLAKILNGLGWPRLAALACRDAVAARPLWADAHQELGESLGHAQDWAAAARAFEQAVRLKPDNGDARGGLAVACARSGRVADALAAVEVLGRQRPHDVEIHLILGTLYRQAHRHGEAVRAFRWAVRLPSPPVMRRCTLGESLLGPEAWSGVVAAWRQAASLAPAAAPAASGRSSLNQHPSQTAGEFRRVAPQAPLAPQGRSRWSAGTTLLSAPFRLLFVALRSPGALSKLLAAIQPSRTERGRSAPAVRAFRARGKVVGVSRAARPGARLRRSAS